MSADRSTPHAHAAPKRAELLQWLQGVQGTEVWQQSLGWQPNPVQQRQFQALYTEILAGNQLLNLTRITDPAEFWEKHLWDSLWGIAPWLQAASAVAGQGESPLLPPCQMIDVGTGGGFPGLPVAIAQPTWRVTLLDATRKKVTFLDTLRTTLGLKMVMTLCDRAENLGHNPNHRQTFDLALIRAVGPASVCAEYILPLLKVGGRGILYRGQWTTAETTALAKAAQQLGGELADIRSSSTPLTHSIRHCIEVRKYQPTPLQFPRSVGLPAKSPL